MNDIRACLQRLVEIWDEPNLRHEMPGAMWKAKEALKADGADPGMRVALLRICFDDELDMFAGDPERWPYTVAYRAPGGRFADGVSLDYESLKAEAQPFLTKPDA